MRGALGSRHVSGLPEGAALPLPRGVKRRRASPGVGPAEKQLRSKTVGAPGLESGPAAAAKTVAEFHRMVSGVEADVREAHDLLRRCRWEVLNDEQWMTLSVLIESVRDALWGYEDEWGGRLQRLRKDGGLSTSDSEALSASQRRLDDARRFFDSGDMLRKTTVRPIRTTLPVGLRTPVVVESRMVPATALGGRFAGGVPALRRADPLSIAMFSYLTSLDQTVLTGADGEVLFSGLIHVDIPPPNLAAMRLEGMTDEELRDLIGRMHERELGQYRIDAQTRARVIEGFLMDIGQSRWRAAQRLQAIRGEARRLLTRVVVTAALVADSARLHRAVEGETVDLHLGVVSLPGINDFRSCEHERRAFAELCRPAIWLQVNGPQGEPRNVRAKVDVSLFSMGHGDSFLFSDGATEIEVQQLLGSGSTRELGGMAAARIRSISARVAQLRSELGGLGAERLRTTRQPGAERAGALPFGRPPTRTTNEMYRLERAMHRLEISARALQEAGRQVKQVWIDKGSEPVSEELRRQVAARLALIACLMDWTPVTVARIGYAAAETVDAEVKFLATVADCNAGHLPPIDRDEALWGPARSDFEWR